MKKQTFGEQIKDYREDHELTQQQFAELVGLNQSHISLIENGNDFMVSTLEKISKICCITYK
jgi:transcriptional regulator with XRE-family HTH domain